MTHSDLCSVHPHNPDPQFSACRNSGMDERGIVFTRVEPLEGVFTFIGESSLLEGVSLLYDMTPKQITECLEGGTKALRVKIGRLEDEKQFLADRLAKINQFIIDAPQEEVSVEPDIT